MHLLQQEEGQDMIEYALIAALVGLGAITALRTLSTKVNGSFSNVGTALANATA
jgi:pilus assembly protein Flp/PilA